MTNERWRANYRANPYLIQLDDDAVRSFGEKAIGNLMPYFLVGAKRSVTELEPLFERWTHFLEEASDRGLDAREMGISVRPRNDLSALGS